MHKTVFLIVSLYISIQTIIRYVYFILPLYVYEKFKTNQKIFKRFFLIARFKKIYFENPAADVPIPENYPSGTLSRWSEQLL